MGRFYSKKVKLENGDVFDSITEYDYWNVLLLQQEQGLIWNLERQKPFLLQESFKDKNGKTIRKMEYIADFVFEDKNGLHITDSKGSIYLIEETFKIKWKLLKFRLPECNYHIIIKDKSGIWTDLENKAEVKAMKEREKAIPKKVKKTKKKQVIKK